MGISTVFHSDSTFSLLLCLINPLPDGCFFFFPTSLQGIILVPLRDFIFLYYDPLCVTLKMYPICFQFPREHHSTASIILGIFYYTLILELLFN